VGGSDEDDAAGRAGARSAGRDALPTTDDDDGDARGVCGAGELDSDSDGDVSDGDASDGDASDARCAGEGGGDGDTERGARASGFVVAGVRACARSVAFFRGCAGAAAAAVTAAAVRLLTTRDDLRCAGCAADADGAAGSAPTGCPTS
jgi:hypothetical protein